MESFELKVDTNTTFIRIIRFLGTLALGFFIGVISIKYKYEGTIDWMNAFVGIVCSLSFAFFPGAAKKQSLKISEDGISQNTFWGRKKQYDWSKIKAVEVKKNRIELTKSIGSTERIKLPIHTKDQVKNLKNYLQQVTDTKEIAYK
ncbi:hypothetical protein CK503_01765 [Aliifodinibius salipaludis]|uniref:Uncharacterized protein n=1 Tax=Fodinibius salipaludis TaxID=2032627 RepID=A0A2A2GE65_9BACT|nr:hypothetical protein [Aliifodinibius salipaludis]PAU95811.1 hypothetical protein CK503_01765 [Aliifodinibius salipaludis]